MANYSSAAPPFLRALVRTASEVLAASSFLRSF